MSILERITERYLSSGDFNGLPLGAISDFVESDLLTEVATLLAEGKIDLLFGGLNTNPAIKSWPPEAPETQRQYLDELGLHSAWAYPSQTHLRDVVRQSDFEGQPYTLCLALGEPQLLHKAFDLAVLERFRNDPRYRVRHNDISGDLSVADDELPESEEIRLETFGFGYDEDGNRAVVAFLRYLGGMTMKQQRVWATYELAGTFWLHPDYRNIALGIWDLGRSIFEAFLAEQREVNRICALIGRQPLFLKDYSEPPPGFGWILRPTQKQYNEFVHLLDKLMSDNINCKFFRGEVEEFHTAISGGIVERRPKGSIQLLEEWFTSHFHMADPQPLKEMFQTFRDIRVPRSKSAHSVTEDKYSRAFFDQQRALVERAYRVVQGLRLAFQHYPNLKNYAPPADLDDLRVWLA